MQADTDPTPRLVLDTNVVLDWLVFANPACTPLADAIETGRVRWIATRAMHAELQHVLARGTLAAWRPDLAAIDAAHTRWVRYVDETTAAATHRWRCTDPDDQKFIDLALQLGDATLLSRDRAVLKLARRVREAGVTILTPQRWAALQASPPPARG